MKNLLGHRALTLGFTLFCLALLVLVTGLYLRNTASNIVLRSSLHTWVQFAASTNAMSDYAKGEKAFYQLDQTVKNNTVVGSRDGYPVKAWSFPQDAEGCNQQFVDKYNERMQKLIFDNKDN
jgi:hypothetical protein